MKAVCWHGKYDLRVDPVPDPQILNPHDAIIKITSTAIWGSDLHIYDGYIPTLQAGEEDAPRGYDIFGSRKENCTKIVMHPRG